MGKAFKSKQNKTKQKGKVPQLVSSRNRIPLPFSRICPEAHAHDGTSRRSLPWIKLPGSNSKRNMAPISSVKLA